MARTADPTNLDASEAAKFRATIRRVRQLKRLSNDQIAYAMKWDPRQLTNAMTDGRALRAADARQIHRTVADLNPARRPSKVPRDPAAADLLLEQTRQAWFRRGVEATPALIPACYIDGFVDLIAKDLKNLSAPKIRAIKSTIAHNLRNKRRDMAHDWADATAMYVLRMRDLPKSTDFVPPGVRDREKTRAKQDAVKLIYHLADATKH